MRERQSIDSIQERAISPCQGLRTPLGTGMLPPSYAMRRGQPLAGGWPVGNLILEVHVIELELPPVTPPAVTERVVPEREPDNCGGFGGRNPDSYCWMNAKISLRRHAHSSAVVTLLPLANVKGSGSALSLKPESVRGVVEHAERNVIRLLLV